MLLRLWEWEACDMFQNRSREDLSCPTVPCRPEDIKFGPDGFDFTAPEPMPTAAQERVQELLDSARLFRYQGGDNDVAQLEKEFASFVGVPYAMACNSGGCGLGFWNSHDRWCATTILFAALPLLSSR